MAKIAIKFALKHQLRLGRDLSSGLYYIVDPNSTVLAFGRIPVAEMSHKPTGKSAICMMKRYLRAKGV